MSDEWKIKAFEILLNDLVGCYCPGNFQLEDVNFEQSEDGDWCEYDDSAKNKECQECWEKSLKKAVQK